MLVSSKVLMFIENRPGSYIFFFFFMSSSQGIPSDSLHTLKAQMPKVAAMEISDLVEPLVHSHTPGFLQTIAVSDCQSYQSQQPGGYFSFPAEIRNKIMGYLLVHGEVVLESGELGGKLSPFQEEMQRIVEMASMCGDKDPELTNVPRHSALQLLATCKQACAEGHAVFYSSNYFVLPQGPLECTRRAWETLQPQHQAMMNKFGMIMSLHDLTPRFFGDSHHAMAARYSDTTRAGPNSAQAVQRDNMVEKQLKRIWKEKVNFVAGQSGCSKLLIRVVTAQGVRRLDQEDLTNTVEFLEDEEDVRRWPRQLRSVWCSAARRIGEDFELWSVVVARMLRL